MKTKPRSSNPRKELGLCFKYTGFMSIKDHTISKVEEGCWGPRGDFVCMVFIAVTVIPSTVPSWKKSSILLVK